METDVVVEHPRFGTGEILEINYDAMIIAMTGNPLIFVRWENDEYGYYGTDELEFVMKNH